MIEPLWEAGALFAGKYRIEGVLGRGGMGVVLGARHARLDEPLAIKVLLPAMMDTPGVVDRFLREAKAATKIKSEHVARVIDIDTLPTGVPFMVMERLEGEDLAALCKRRHVIEIEEAVGWVVQACDAVAHAHARGIVHRDLKPGNLFLAEKLDGSRVIKVLDFGISKVTSEDGEHAVTEAGVALGSPSYMSPEQMRSARDVDARTDIWALGAVLYRLLTGRPPFRAATLQELYSIVMNATLERPSEMREDIPPALDAVLVRCLEKDRDRRMASAMELAKALLPFAGEGARLPVVIVRVPSLVSIDASLAPAGDAPAPSIPPSAEHAIPGVHDATTSPESRRSFETSDSAQLGTSAVRARVELEPIARSVPPKRNGVKRRAAFVALGAVVGALAILAAGLRFHFVLRGSDPVAAGAGNATAAAVAAPIGGVASASAEVASAPSRDVGTAEPIVVPVEAAVASASAAPKRIPRREPVEKKAATRAIPTNDPFGGVRK